jgi:hypothetical protein
MTGKKSGNCKKPDSDKAGNNKTGNTDSDQVMYGPGRGWYNRPGGLRNRFGFGGGRGFGGRGFGFGRGFGRRRGFGGGRD